jgi:uncharacterized lipoprotein YddW (UPF0748 family)
MPGQAGMMLLAVVLGWAVTAPWALAGEGTTGADIERFDYPDVAALRAVWSPINAVSPLPEIAAGPDGEPVARFELPFSTLKDWRVAWDREGPVDLSGADRILVRMRTDDPGAATGMLYAHTGDGWYNFPPVGLDSEWVTAVFWLGRAGREGQPGGWGGVDRLRLGFQPGAGRDTVVEVAWIRAAKGWLPEDIGRLERFGSFEESRDHILGAVRAENREAIEDRLDRVRVLRAEILSDPQGLDGPAAAEKARTCRDLMAQAYAMIQKPKLGEIRGFWCHYGSGPVIDGKRASWAKAIPMIADGGLNAIFPNMLFSGVAYYPSKVVPTHPVVAEEGDQLAACIKACREHGVQVHVWKVCWQIGWQAQPGAAEPFREQNRLQVDLSGDTLLWLCPSDPRNRKYELDALLEVADYDIDGVHLDYIRYNGPNVCYCAGCRERFGAQSGEPVVNWPADVAPGGPRADSYAAFRREQITGFVREVRQALKEKKPGLKLSAAVFPHAPSALRVSQDWPSWVDEGLLDFVCPMVYTDDMAYFRSTVGEVMARVAGRAQVCPGIKASMRPRPESATPLDVLVDQVTAARDLGARGFVFFELWEFQKTHLMPYLKAGIASEN